MASPKHLIALMLLAGCTPPELNTAYRSDGERIDLAYVVLAPLCVLFCNTQLSSTGSQTNAGDGANTANTQSTSQTTSTGVN